MTFSPDVDALSYRPPSVPWRVSRAGDSSKTGEAALLALAVGTIVGAAAWWKIRGRG